MIHALEKSFYLKGKEVSTCIFFSKVDGCYSICSTLSNDNPELSSLESAYKVLYLSNLLSSQQEFFSIRLKIKKEASQKTRKLKFPFCFSANSQIFRFLKKYASTYV